MRIYDVLTERRKLVITERLKRLPIWGHPALRVRFRLEGTDGYVFGCRAGPSMNFRHLAHELAHAVQFGADSFAKRMQPCGSYRFKCRKLYVLGRAYDEPITDQCSRREAETFAIQLHLMQMTGMKFDLPAYKARVASLLEFLPDWHTIPRDKRVKIVSKMVDQYYAKWSPQKIMDGLSAWLDCQQARLQRPRNPPQPGEADISFEAPVRPRSRRKPQPALVA